MKDKKLWLPYYRRWGGGHHHYEPFYDFHADYNTNAKDYYDYLARFNAHIKFMTEFINRLMDRNIDVIDTNSIDMTKIGDWIDNGKCEPDNYDDVIKIKADVIISKLTETLKLVNTTQKNFIISNGTKIKSDGVWSPDYADIIKEIDREIGKIQDLIKDLVQDINNMRNELNKLKTDITNLTNGLQKIINNLFESGAISSDNINNFVFNSGRDIATGNINLFGGTSDGNSFIRTNKGKTNNDISAGY